MHAICPLKFTQIRCSTPSPCTTHTHARAQLNNLPDNSNIGTKVKMTNHHKLRHVCVSFGWIKQDFNFHVVWIFRHYSIRVYKEIQYKRVFLVSIKPDRTHLTMQVSHRNLVALKVTEPFDDPGEIHSRECFYEEFSFLDRITRVKQRHLNW